jgi:hypothetical protein
MTTLTRRKAMTAIAAAPVAVALPVSATEANDDELRRLWAEYLARLEAYQKAREIHMELRKPFDAEFGRLRDNWQHRGGFGELHNILWPKYKLEPSSRAWVREGNKLRRIVKVIRKAKAETLFGIGVKLSVTDDPSDPWWEEALDDARRSIAKLTGTDFIAATGPALET